MDERSHHTHTERALAFSDTWCLVNDDGLVKTKVYHKRAIRISISTLEHKRGVVKTHIHQVDSMVSDERDKVEEKPYVKQALNMNGYPYWLINSKSNDSTFSRMYYFSL